LQFANSWSLLLLAKHIVFLLMIGVSLVTQWGVKPALDRAALLARNDDQTQAGLYRRLRRLTAINLIFGVLVLLLTAFITAL
jgi:putative copper export protein